MELKKHIRIFTFLLFITITSFAEENERVGKFYIYWGYNWDSYTKSDIHFTGSSYDFTLKNVVGKQRQSPFGFNTYFNPTLASIPQFNFRLGYFLSNKYNISFGMDHMKYVVQQHQVVKISGDIKNQEAKYNGTYSDNNIEIVPDFLMFEHTNGLNYLNLELRRFHKVAASDKLSFNVTGGLGSGVLFPRTDATLMTMQRHDAYHVAGYGVSGVVGVNIGFLKYFFIQSEFKGGFINMPDIRTTKYDADRASQHFLFSQFNVVLGAMMNLKPHKNKEDKK